MNHAPSSPPSPAARRTRRVGQVVRRPSVMLAALVALIAIIAGGAATMSSFTSQTGTQGNTFATKAQFDVRLAGTAPTISGTPADGSVLTGTMGTWQGSPTNYAWQFQRCDSTATNCIDVGTAGSAATPGSKTYTLVQADAGNYMRFKLTATNAVSSKTVYSPLTAIVTSPKAHNIIPPVITSGGRAGDTLTTDGGTWGGTPAPTVTYAWSRCDAQGANCIVVAGANGLTFPTTLDDQGATLKVVVTAANQVGGTSYSVQLPASKVIKQPVLSAVAGIVGTAEVDMRLTSSPGFNGPVNESTVQYQWQRCTSAESCADIPGETGPNYTTTTDDIGKFLRYHLKATSADGDTSVDKDGVLTDSAVKARRVSSVGDAPTALTTADDGRLFVGGPPNMKFAKVYTGPLAAVSADGVGELSQVSKTPLIKSSNLTSTAVVGDGQGGYILGVTGLQLPDGTTRSLIHIKGDGTIDLSYPDTNSGGRVVALARGKDNTIYVGGVFTTLKGVARNNAGAIAADGTVTSWIANANGGQMVYGVATAPGGRVYLTGDFTAINGVARNRIALITTDGTLQPFNPPLSVWGGAAPGHCVGGRSVKVAEDGIVYMTGFNCEALNGAPVRGYAAAFKPDGTVLPGFTMPSFGDNPHDLWVSDTKLYVGGFFQTANGQSRKYIARFDRLTGAMDSWAPSFNGVVWDIIQQGNTVYTVGEYTQVDGVDRTYASALRADTAAVLPWAPKIDGAPNDMVLEGGGIQMTGAGMKWWGAQTRSGLAVLDTNGQLQDTKITMPAGRVDAIAVNGADAWIGGSFTSVNGAARTGLARIGAVAGDLKADVYSQVTGSVRALLYDNNSLWVGGSWGGATPNLTRYDNGAASSLSSRRPTVNQFVYSFAKLPGGKVAIGAGSTTGQSTDWTATAGGVDCAGVLKNMIAIWVDGPTGAATCPYGIDFTATSTTFATTNPAIVTGGAIFGIAAQPTIQAGPISRLQAAGYFKNYATNLQSNGAQWNWAAGLTGASKTLDFNAISRAVVWSPGANAFITAGDFTGEKNGTTPYVVAHAADSDTPLSTWKAPTLGGVPANESVNALAVDGAVVYMAGGFTTVSPSAGKPEPSGNLIALRDTSGAWLKYGE
jgi:hypothetical protein